MRTFLLLVFSFMLSIGAAFAQTARLDRIEITEAGIYELKTVKTYDSPGTAAGDYTITEGKLIQSTTTIPAQKGISFGYTYKLIGSPTNADVTVKDINIVPEPGLRNPKTGNIIFREEVQYAKKIGEVYRSDYTLSYDWALLPGKWTFQLWYGDRKMAEQIFILVKR